MNNAKAGFFDSQVEEPWAGSPFGPAETAKIDRMLGKARIERGAKVIEPGCGTGRLTSVLADLVGPAGFVDAFDISSKMVEAARRRIGNRGNVSLSCGPIEGYPFKPANYDLVVCHNVFPHFDDKRVAVADLASALKIGGGFVVFHFMTAAEINDLHRKAHASVLNDLIPHEPEMKEILGSAGLRIESLQDDESGYLLCAERVR
ncbi:MAG: class I SAM-dependent methyltransferase [Pseudomonadota bacterium]